MEKVIKKSDNESIKEIVKDKIESNDDEIDSNDDINIYGDNIYILQRFGYEDDYKHRYDSGFYPKVLGIYKSYEKAYNEKIRLMIESIEDKFNDYEPKAFKSYFIMIDDEYRLKEKIKEHEDSVESIHEDMHKGEFVDTTESFDIGVEKLII